MIDEILFMEMRILRLFCQEYGRKISEVNSLFNQYGIWDYIEECYDILHVNGDEYILESIKTILKAKGGLSVETV